MFIRHYSSEEISEIRGKPWVESILKATEARKRNAARRRADKKK
jgi:hypothetical protein